MKIMGSTRGSMRGKGESQHPGAPRPRSRSRRAAAAAFASIAESSAVASKGGV